MKTVLAFDFGTQSAKGAIVDETGAICARAKVSYGFCVNQGGFLEQNPEDWWEALVSMSHSLQKSHPAAFSAICSVGISGQMHGIVGIDSGGNPVRNCIVWCDTRSVLQAQQMEAACREQGLPLQNPAISAYTGPKLLWIKEYDWNSFTKIRVLLYCKDYLRFRLSGELCTDVSDASGSLLYDFSTGAWDYNLIQALGLRESTFPKIVESGALTGQITKAASEATGIPPSATIAAGAGDLVCSLLGNGLFRQGSVLINLGTAGQIMTVCEPDAKPPAGVHRFQLTDRSCSFTLSSLQSAAYCLRWFLENICPIPSDPSGSISPNPFALMDEMAGKRPVGSSGLIFLPYLNGTGNPHLDDDASACFIGLTASHTKDDMIRAVMEGVAYGVCDALDGITYNKPSSIFFSGGGSYSPLWRQIMSDVLGAPLFCSKQAEASLMGAAMLAMTASGLAPSLLEASKLLPKPDVQHPIGENTNRYQEMLALYRSCYWQNKNILRQLEQFRKNSSTEKIP